jgi:hypothetical protein
MWGSFVGAGPDFGIGDLTGRFMIRRPAETPTGQFNKNLPCITVTSLDIFK